MEVPEGAAALSANLDEPGASSRVAHRLFVTKRGLLWQFRRCLSRDTELMTINSGRSEAGEFIFFEVRPYRKQHELPNDCPKDYGANHD